MPKDLSRLRTRAASIQSFRCIYCHLPVWTGDPQPFMQRFHLTLREARALQCTAEHLLARCDGGKDSNDNIAAACLHCNRTRHQRAKPLDPLAYQSLVQQRLSRGAWHPRSITSKVAVAPNPPLAKAGRSIGPG